LQANKASPLLTHGKAASLPLFSACFLHLFIYFSQNVQLGEAGALAIGGSGNFFLLVAERSCHFLPKTTPKMDVKPSPFQAMLLTPDSI